MQLNNSERPNAPLRILISTPKVGGVGGMQRNLLEVCKALSKDKIDIVGTEIVTNGFYPCFEHVTIFDLHAEIAGRRLTPRDYDIYIQYRSSGTFYLVGKYFSSRLTLIIPCGNSAKDVENNFDYVIKEANDGSRYFTNHAKGALLPPPVTKTVDTKKTVEGLPDKFFLSIFNPYPLKRNYSDGFKPTKGYDLLYKIAPSIHHPVVWVYTTGSGLYEKSIKTVENIVYKLSISQEEIAYLYEHCLAYISFSREESYGFSVADALIYGKPVFSRDLGVVTLFEDRNIHKYSSGEELIKLLNNFDQQSDRHEYDLRVFSPDAFRSRLRSLCASKKE